MGIQDRQILMYISCQSLRISITEHKEKPREILRSLHEGLMLFTAIANEFESVFAAKHCVCTWMDFWICMNVLMWGLLPVASK